MLKKSANIFQKISPMKKLLDAQSKSIVNIYDEINLWSAPFGRLLLENIPMQSSIKILDLGFGTGFPLIELSQRFGESSKIYGIDIWAEAINRTKNKIKLLELKNIEILETSAISIPLADQQINLITSNLGVNNFEERKKVYAEMHRVLKTDGSICITTNPMGTFEELFDLFSIVFKEMGLEDELEKLNTYLQHRNTKASIEAEFKTSGFKLVKSKSDHTNMRFSDPVAVLNHSLIRIGFRRYWEKMIQEEMRADFFKRLLDKIGLHIQSEGAFSMKIPILYLEFRKSEYS